MKNISSDKEQLLNLIMQSYYYGRMYQLWCGLFGKAHADKKKMNGIKARKHFEDLLNEIKTFNL